MTTEETKTIVTILAHKLQVTSYLSRFADEIKNRALEHDASKLSNDEFSGFVQINRIAREHKYGSPEYMKSVKKTNAVELHYCGNPHHPEHYQNGIDDMTLFDIIEMVVDWKAASKVYGQTSLEDSLVVSAKRFNLQDKHIYLIKLIINALEGG
jgi:hypothetical protein